MLVSFAAAWSVWRLVVHRPFPRRWPLPDRDSAAAFVRGRNDERPADDRPSPGGAGSGVEPGNAHGDPAALAATVDLLAVAVSAGLSLPVAVDAVGGSGQDPASRAFAAVATELSHGVPFHRALDRLEAHLGGDVRSLRATLAAASTSGAPVGDSLRSQAERLRRRHRRRLEQRIRRLPVLLILPLCLFVLPAFVVVTIVPVAWTAATQLDLDPVAPP